MQHRRRNEVYEEETGTMELPQAFPDDGPTSRKVKVEGRQRKRKPGTPGQSSRGSSGWVITFSLLTVVVLVAAYFLIAEHEKTQIEHAREDVVHQQVEPLSKEWEQKYAKLEEENEQMKSHEMEYERMKSKTEKMIETENQQKKQIETQLERIEYFKKYRQEIKQRIKLMSHSVLVEK
jgi:septal ring factor EnvC (AmiA/AmiB activator)